MSDYTIYMDGPAADGDAQEHYVQSGGRRLRCGYTTGTCAALAASGAARRLLLGRFPERVSLTTPKGWRVETPLEEPAWGEGWAACGVRKDGGDDVDETHGALICAKVELAPEPEVRVLGGTGVGRVTKPGLDQPVGESAINRVPRQMITQAVEQVCRLADYGGGLTVTISVPRGEEIAKKTFNPHLGIQGGISILGTSGVVEPMSAQALIDTIAVELRQAAAQGHRRVILTPGNYGLDFLKGRGLDKLDVPVVRCSNFIGDSLDAAGGLGFQDVLLVGHMGKLVKLAAGIMNTHSRWADGRGEVFCAHAAIAGASPQLCRELMDAATTDACLELLEGAGLKEPVLASLLERTQARLDRRAGGRYRVGAVVFSNVYGELGQTAGAKELLERWK
ncbi:MAG: cobalt-precorrin-5B (C(1))-methyltransferase CbiD [Oscillospiraceae bacterium]|nr:cobalt-precorrin-5B (C(1))-methyltransferase CbiD [Oscillospiraceae bacterium]